MGLLAASVGGLVKEGARIEIQCGPGERSRRTCEEKGLLVPEPISVEAMIDTGSRITIIDEELADELSLTPVGATEFGKFPLGTVGNDLAIRGTLCDAWLRFPQIGGFTCQTLVAATSLPLFRPVRCLLGRQDLAKGVFVYLGKLEAFSIGFG